MTWKKLINKMLPELKDKIDEVIRMDGEGEDLLVIADKLILSLTRALTAVNNTDFREWEND